VAIKNIIVVNATSLEYGGALTILNQFIGNIVEDNYSYVIFVCAKYKSKHTKRNIQFVQVNAKSSIKRIMWDAFGLKKWLWRNQFNPIASISLQNTNFRCGKSIPNFIYYHQPIPLYNRTWSFLNPVERRFWFYKHIYPYFIKLFINNTTEIFVQIRYIKDSFSKHFNFAKRKIHIIRPMLEVSDITSSGTPKFDNKKMNLIYPATSLIYKNHTTIIKAISLLDQDLQKKLMLHLTCRKQDLDYILINTKIYFSINFMGNVSYNDIIAMYKEADALLFPSYIETFGLPLLEAAFFGTPIITADLPYSHDVLQRYTGARYVLYNNAKIWSEEIKKLFSRKGERFQPIRIEQSNSWEKLFFIIKDRIGNHVE